MPEWARPRCGLAHLPYLQARRERYRCRVGQRADVEQITQILQKPPPRVEWISIYEVYLLDEDGKRKRRICGRPRHGLRLPDFIPEGIPNPYGVLNPYDEYCCLQPAGWSFKDGFGPCRIHAAFVRNADLRKEQYSQRVASRQALLKEGIAIPLMSFKNYMQRAQAEVSIEELYDHARPLYELEALKLMLEERASEGVLDKEQIDQMISIIDKSANVKLTLAKFDQKLLKNQGVERLVEALVHGMLSIVERIVNPDQMIDVLDAFREDVLLPINEQGYTELFLRQRAAGLHEKYDVVPPTGNPKKVPTLRRAVVVEDDGQTGNGSDRSD